MPGWSNSNRRDRLPPDWPKIRRRVMRRDQGMCQWELEDGTFCLAHATDVDHIKAGDDHRDENLRCLCSMHHRRKSSSEGGAAKAAARRKVVNRYKRTESHPGAL